MSLPADPWLTAAEAAEEARCNPYTIREACRRSELSASKRGRIWLIRRSALDAWIEEGAA